MHETTSANPAATQTADPKRRYLCRHVFTEGHRCGSPALRGQDLCYYHHASRREPRLAGHNGCFLMPRIDDRPAIQIALYDVLGRLSLCDIDLKRAGMLLYGLQIASSNLGKHQKSAAANPEPLVEDITSNPFLGDLAPVAEIPDPEAQAQPVLPQEAVILTPSETQGKDPCIQPEAPKISRDTPQPAPSLPKGLAPQMGSPTSNQQPATFSPLHAVLPRQSLTLAAVHATANLQPATDNLQLPAPPRYTGNTHDSHPRMAP